jgi:hypothetical protein
VAATASFVDPQNGDLATAEHVAQLVEDFQGLRNVPLSVTGINDAASYALTLKNAGTNSRGLIVYAADGSTVLLQVDGSGVLASAAGGPAGGIITNTPGSITNAMLGADVARDSLLVNGSFDNWQRGVGPFTANGAYSADRWLIGLIGTDTLSVSRDTANADVSSQYCAACTFVLGTGAGGTSLVQQSNDTYLSLRGKTVTVSARVKTTVANGMRLRCNDGGTTGVQRGNFHSGSGVYETISLTYAVSTNAVQFAINFEFDVSGTYYLDNAMLVVGSQAASYVPMHPADDLARCLRYYEVLGSGSTAGLSMGGYMSAGGTVYMPLVYKAVKAVAPTVTKNGTWTVFNCAQPTVGGPDVTLVQLAAVVTALGAYNFFNNGAGQNISVEANP